MSSGPLFRSLRRFLTDCRGSVSVEFVLVAPFLFWALMACYDFFDGYRQSAVNVKAANTIADLISRETATVDDRYIDSMHEMMKLLIRSGRPVQMRISVLRWDEDDDRYYVDWSVVRNRTGALSDATVGDIADRLPVMTDNDRVILVETSTTYTPLFRTGLRQAQLENFVFTRPRFAPQVAGVW